MRDAEGKEFKLGLKCREAWWCEGGVKEHFKGQEKLSWGLLWRDCYLPGRGNKIVLRVVE